MSGSEGRTGERESVERGVEVEEEEEEAQTAGHREKERWSEGSKLFSQPGYLKVLKSIALSGQLQQYNMRSVIWRLFLNVLPEDQTQWETVTVSTREKYEHIRRKHVMDPHSVTASLDIALNNPLSQSDESPWNRFFQDNELRQLVSQDVVRTFPDVPFFREDDIQQMMEDILFCYVKEHPDLGYRQGMHELLAPILFVMNTELREVNKDNSLTPVLKVVMDPTYIEHDAFAIFVELMEMVEPWYSCAGLEADQVKARQQASLAQRKNMTRDPRTSRPFQGDLEFSGPSSAISRKLDVVHNVLLKKADEVLYLHLKQLAIPAQTYGIRWIRLLFGREFPLPNVLEVWDALFADGPSLVDYMCVSMLVHIREVLIEGDYATCMHHLMHFPTVYEVNYLIQRSLHFRNPAQHPSPRVWSHHPYQTHHNPPSLPTHHPHPPPSTHPPPLTNNTTIQKPQRPGIQDLAKKAGNRLASGILRAGGGEGKSPASSPPPIGGAPGPLPTHNHTSVPKATSFSVPRKGRGRIIGEVGSEKEKEMKNNPKIQSPSTTSMSQLERLTGTLDDCEAKLAYCGSKMDSLLLSMEEEISGLTDKQELSPETENTLLLSLAGLKHVRDILLNKIAFSGAMLKDEHNVVHVKRPPQQDDLNKAHPLEQCTQTSAQQEPLSVTGSNGDAALPREWEDMPPETSVPHPLMSSEELERQQSEGGGGGQEEQDWVNVPVLAHPLINSDS